MTQASLSDEAAIEAVNALTEHGSTSKAALALGIARSTFQNRLLRAAQRGLDGSVAAPVPTGQIIKGLSTLYDAGGNKVLEWVKTRSDDSVEALSQAIRDAFDGYLCPAILPPPPAITNTDLLTIYPIADLHLGLFSWAKETGSDYDLKIASDLLKSSVSDLVARAANSERAIVLDLGDYLHGDNSRNQTSRSGNPLDIDSRYSKVIQVGVELAVHCIELALQKHKYVIYRKLPGNHDEETSLMLAIALAAWFRDNERVSVDTNPSRFFMHQHGLCMITATHGDMLKMGDMAGYMAAQWPKEWGATEFRHAYTGHIHNEKVRTDRGVRVESFNTLAAKDAWHSGMGYQAPRSMVAITLHKERGETDRLTVTVPR